MVKYLLMCVFLSTSFFGMVWAESGFPMPSAIDANVKLWANVYGRWGQYEAAIFDRDDLGIVYTVVVLPKNGDRVGGLRADQITSSASERVKTILKKFHHDPPKSDSGLAGLERDVFHSLEHVNAPEKYVRWESVGVIHGLKERFAEGYKLSGAHAAQIEERLAANDLPKELLGIVFVESMFFNRACSKAGACGLWQLLRGTARENIYVNKLVDERFDPVLATGAAINYLKGAYKKFNSWPLAITSYNYGRAGIQRALNTSNVSNFSELYTNYQGSRFKFAAKNYYAEFLAALQVYENAEQLFPEVSREKPWDYEVFTLPHAVFFDKIEGIPELKSNLALYNPALTADTKKGKEVLPEGFRLRIPSGFEGVLTRHLRAIPLADKRKAEQIVRARHRATGRQSLFQIAREHDISHSYLQGLGYHAKPARGTVVVLRSAGSKFSEIPAQVLATVEK